MTDLAHFAPPVSFISELNEAYELGLQRGLSVRRMAELAADFAEDLRDIADDSQQPTQEPRS